MRATVSLISLLLTAAIGMGIYYFYLKTAAPVPGTVATQAISTTGVEMDLNGIAQAERMYFAQNGSYATLDQLASSGTLNIPRTERDGYRYEVEASAAGFTATARHPDVPADPAAHASSLHYPELSIDQNMQLQQGN